HDHYALDAGHQVHGAAHALDHLAGHHPIGEVAVLRHFHAAQDGQIDVSAANHREAVRGGEIRGHRQLRDGLLAGVDQVGVLLALPGERPHAEHSVLGLQHHFHSLWDVVRHQRGNTDAEIDVETVLELLRRACGHLIAIPGHMTLP